MKRILAMTLIVPLILASTACGSDEPAPAAAGTEPAEAEVSFALDDLLTAPNGLTGDISCCASIDFETEDGLGLTYQSGTWGVTTAGLGIILDKLGFNSEVVAGRMKKTRALDGTQTARSDVAMAHWTYHPDAGLSIIFERI